MNSKHRLVQIAKKEALKSDHIYKVGAVIWKRKSVLSVGKNCSSRSVRSVTKQFLKFPEAVHAEVSAIVKARRDLSGASILVVRVTRSGELSMSRPCDRCLSYILHVGIKDVYFSNRLGEIEHIRL
jgi:deoxycytidylate deaminase